jgi:hypothetical protein
MVAMNLGVTGWLVGGYLNGGSCSLFIGDGG